MKNVFKKIAALSLCLAMSMSLFACSGTDTTPVATETTFTYAVGGEPDVLDPAVGTDAVTSAITNQIYYPLFSIGADGSMVNDACESYTVSDDGLTYTFKLIDNNYWSDGVKVTAADYVYGMKRSVGMGAADSYYSYFITDYVLNAKAYGEAMADVADMTDIGIVATDDSTIVITLAKPCTYFVNLMSAGVFYPLRAEFATEHDSVWANDATVPTNGAFQTTKIDSAEEYIMVKNTYFAHADEVKIDTLVAKVMADMDAQLMAFQTGEIDMATSVNSDVTSIYEGKDELVISDSVINYYVMLNAYSTENVALQDVNVRKALQLAINRDDLITVLDAGSVYYPLYGYVPNGFSGIDGDFRAEQDASNILCSYDPEAAIALLAAAGYDSSNPLKFTYYYNQSTMHDTIAQVLQQQWAAIGVEVTLKTGEIRTFFDDRTNGLFETARGAMSADYMDVSTFLDMAASWNQAGVSWGDATYDSMILASQAETDPTARLQILHDAETYLVQTMAYTIPLFGYSSIYLVKVGTSGVLYNPQGSYTFWYTTVSE